MPLTAFDGTARTVGMGCADCGLLSPGLPLATAIQVEPARPGRPANDAVPYFVCPGCGRPEALSTTLTAEDCDPATDGNYPWRAQQATMIRALCAALGIPPA